MWTLSKTRHLEAELLSTTNVILPVAGADYVGPLPAELQGYVDFAVGVRAVSKRPDAAQALAEFMSITIKEDGKDLFPKKPNRQSSGDPRLRGWAERTRTRKRHFGKIVEKVGQILLRSPEHIGT